MDIESEITSLLSSMLKNKKIGIDDKLINDLGMTSFEVFELFSKIDDVFKIDLGAVANEGVKLDTPRDIIDTLKTKI